MTKLHGVEIDESVVGREIRVIVTTSSWLTEGNVYSIKAVSDESIDILDDSKNEDSLYGIDAELMTHLMEWEWVEQAQKLAPEIIKSTKAQRKTAAGIIRSLVGKLNTLIREAEQAGIEVDLEWNPIGENDPIEINSINYQPPTPKKEEY
jgi:hypothetical protein